MTGLPYHSSLLRCVAVQCSPPTPPRSGDAVDALAEQVRMAVVPGIFLDHVDIDPAQIDRYTPLRMHECVVERAPHRHRPCQPDLLYECGKVGGRVCDLQ